MNIQNAIVRIHQDFLSSAQIIQREHWQAVRVVNEPGSIMMEQMHVRMEALLIHEGLDYYQRAILPNLPWADRHFEERTCGTPMNPGKEWANWPWGNSAQEHLNTSGKFNHNYMERYWPRFAGGNPNPSSSILEFWSQPEREIIPVNRGIYGEYGDLDSLVSHLASHPKTRQAYFPIFFPEDTGDQNPGRKPCTLGYQFIWNSDNQLDVVYHMRSCDIYRHFRDDVYLTIRLLLWVIAECRKINPEFWNLIAPGRMVMTMSSLHCFENDFRLMEKKYGKVE